MLNMRLVNKLLKFGPIILLYYFSISESDSNFKDYFEVFSFNLQLIIIYFWVLKSPSLIGNGHIFFAGLINDVVLGFPLGLSSLTYLIISLIASYVQKMSVHTTLASDWFTFLFALLFTNIIFGTLIANFSILNLDIVALSYNIFFTLMVFPLFWFLFSFYHSMIGKGKNV